jgi:RHH-type transcriptional regulator, rel operon repressor / antitoxin RelB
MFPVLADLQIGFLSNKNILIFAVMKAEPSIKIKERLAKRVYKLSRDTQRDTAYHLNKALENYLDESDEIREALKRLNNKKDKVISSKDFRKSLGI